MTEFSLKKFRIVNSLLVIFILFTTLLLTKDIIRISLSKRESKINKIEDKTNSTIIKIKDIMGYASILEKNPFGRPLKLIPLISRRDTQTGDPLKELILVGTAVGPENLSYAIFEDKSHPEKTPKQEIFTYGEAVYDYGILTKIEREWIELTYGKKTFKIYIRDFQENGKERKDKEYTLASFARKIGERQYLLDQRKVQQALDNPEQILTDARLLPNIKNGKQEGFKILEVRPGGIYESLGLRNGDILLRVNNLEISNPEVAIQALSALRGMDTVTLDIIRDNVKMTMTYEIE
jgi:general secretion pathway protein C